MSLPHLHDAFGELIYAVALADGHIQAEETAKLKELLANHPWGKDIQWSFDYETRKGRDVRAAYDKALQVLQDHGPDPEYAFLVEVVNAVAEASDGVDAEEKAVIDGFQQSLYQHFLNYMEEHELLE